MHAVTIQYIHWEKDPAERSNPSKLGLQRYTKFTVRYSLFFRSWFGTFSVQQGKQKIVKEVIFLSFILKM